MRLTDPEIVLEEPGTDAEFPQACADRCLAAEGHGVSALQWFPAETVCHPERAKHHRSQRGARQPLRLVSLLERRALAQNEQLVSGRE